MATTTAIKPFKNQGRVVPIMHKGASIFKISPMFKNKLSYFTTCCIEIQYILNREVLEE
jgi:hypothetical protein